MHITDAHSILENSDSERLQSFVVDVFDMVLEGLPVFNPHAIYQLKPQLLIKVGAILLSSA